jgi:hypothetical protein
MMATAVKNEEKIDHLKRVAMRFEAGSSPERRDLSCVPKNVTFIFGICPEGLSPIEFQLAGKSAGEHIDLRFPADQIREIFHHIAFPHIQASDTHGDIWLRATVVGIDTPSPREVVKALAEITNCGGNCTCCGH